MMKYKLIDHTADFGIHVFGADIKLLFANAALAMIDCIADMKTAAAKDSDDEIYVTGDDLPDLMINWLREILFLWTGSEMLVKNVKILSISEYELHAKIKAELFHPDHHFIKNEIKAVTYHQVQVYEGKSGWEAKIIFDV